MSVKDLAEHIQKDDLQVVCEGKKKLVTDWDVEENHYVQLAGDNGEHIGEVTMPDLLEAYVKQHPNCGWVI